MSCVTSPCDVREYVCIHSCKACSSCGASLPAIDRPNKRRGARKGRTV